MLLAGAATAAEPLPAGAHVRAEIQHLGSVSFTAEPSAGGSTAGETTAGEPVTGGTRGGEAAS
nr:hypothetical protein GCM10020093_071680 [Planobispora longispora]